MSGEFLAKGGIKAPFAVVGGGTQPNLLFSRGGAADFHLKDVVNGSAPALQITTGEFYGPVRISPPRSSIGVNMAVKGSTVITTGTAGKVKASYDGGNTWVDLTASMAAGSTWMGICTYQNGKFFVGGSRDIFVGGSQDVWYSSDAKTWARCTLPGIGSGDAVTCCVWANNQFIVGCSNKKIYTSSDGITFTLKTIASPTDYMHIYDIIWDGSKYVAVGDFKFVATSTDLINWTKSSATPSLANECMAIKKVPNKLLYVIAMRDDTVWKSTNLTDWANTNIPVSPSPMSTGHIVVDTDIWISMNNTEGTFYYSLNEGSSWTKQLVAPGDSSKATDVVRYSTDTFGFVVGEELYSYRLQLGVSPVIAQFNAGSITTELPQSTLPNSLVRKDYVDGQITDQVKIQTDTLKTSVSNLEITVKNMQDATLDYGEY